MFPNAGLCRLHGLAEEFFGPFVDAFIEVAKDHMEDEAVIDSFSWSLGLLGCTCQWLLRVRVRRS